MNSGKVATGILAGFAAGALIGILFAPGKGSETRKKIGNRKDEYTEDLKAKYDELRDTVKGKYESTKKAAKELVAKGKDAAAEGKENLENAAWDFKNTAGANYNS